MKKRLVGLLMAFMMLMTLVPATAFGAKLAANGFSGDSSSAGKAGNIGALMNSTGSDHECVPDESVTWYNAEGHYWHCSICGKQMNFAPHRYVNSQCTVCDQIDPNHVCVASTGASWSYDDDVHSRYCTICRNWVGNAEAHTYVDGMCAVCGAANPDHVCVAADDWAAFCYMTPLGEVTDEGHARYCRICGSQMSELEPHIYENGYCKVCDDVDPNHVCVEADFWSACSAWDEEVGDYVDMGHARYCRICKSQMSEPEPHTYEDGRCTVCDYPDPDHKCVADHWESYWDWDEEIEDYVDIGHVQICRICRELIGDIEPHAYEDGGCTVCDAPDPDHKCVAGHWESYWDWDEEIGDYVDMGHAKYCRICYELMSDIEPHIYSNNRCTVCGAPDPDHACRMGSWEIFWEWSPKLQDNVDAGHVRCCSICGKYMTDIESHTYEGGCCTVCDAPDPDHKCVAGDWEPYWDWDEEIEDYVDIGHVQVCRICGDQMSEPESHSYLNDLCTVCGVPDPNHECVAGGWIPYWDLDEEVGTYVDGHVRICRICGNHMSEFEPHNYLNNRCTVCGAVNSNHECVPGRWSICHKWDAEQRIHVDVGHVQHCSICDNWMSDIFPHTYENGRCTVCNAIDPDHVCEDHILCVNNPEGHYSCCSICNKQLSSSVPHTYESGRCTVCYALDPDYDLRKALGNIDGNDTMDAADLTMLLRHVAKIELLDEDQRTRADFNGDTFVDAADITALAMYLERNMGPMG